MRPPYRAPPQRGCQDTRGWGGKLRSTVLILLVGTKLFFICELYLDDIFDHCLLVNSAVYHEAVKVEKTAHKAEITCALCC